MAKYLLDKSETETQTHAVHRADAKCSLAPPAEYQTELGEFDSCDEAISKARTIFADVDGCPECTPECNEQLSRDALIAVTSSIIVLSSS